MDDGSIIKLAITIDRTKRSAIFDFTGTGQETYGISSQMNLRISALTYAHGKETATPPLQ